MFRDSPEFYALLGKGCLRKNDFSGAHSYLMRAKDLDPEDTDTLLALGAVFLRQRQIEKALQTYLSILDISSNHRRAARALAMLRTIETPEAVLEWFETRKINRILPSQSLYVPRWLSGIAIVLFLTAALGFSAVAVYSTLTIRPARPGRETVQLTAADIETRTTGQSDSILTEREIERIFRDIRRNFDAGKDNLVRRDLNRITRSNASLELQDRAAHMWDFLTAPDFSTFQDNFAYSEVIEQPDLYNGTFVKWRGRVANLAIAGETIDFDLLVGYENAQVLLGIVPARIPFAVLLENGNPVEIIGKVVGESTGFSLEITNIRILQPNETSRDSR